MFPESLRWRIQLWHGFLLAAVLTGFASAAYRYQSVSDLRRVDGELRQRVRVLADALAPARRPSGPPPGGGRDFHLTPERAAMFGPTDALGFYYVVWRRDGSKWARSENVPDGIERPARPGMEAAIQGERTSGLLREAFTFTPPGECLLVGRTTAPEQAALREYGRWLAAFSGGVLVLSLAIGWLIATRAIRPVGVITATARRIAQGELGERIPVRETKSELGGLSAVLNETFAQLEDSFTRQSRFTADAAHELRTPVSIILAQAQRALTRERDAATYQQTLEACVNAARRLSQLTESLLELATHDAGALSLKSAPCDLAGIAGETAALIRPIADDRRIALTCEFTPAPCRADAGRIAQVILNLLNNAIDHTPADGRVTLRTGIESAHAIFAITDTGPGIAAEHLPRIFDRFYRTDDSRDRRTGGTGLGLAICKAIADAHAGSLEVRSSLGKGSTFTLRIPVDPGGRD
jgi:heavy metal sensor kinase